MNEDTNSFSSKMDEDVELRSAEIEDLSFRIVEETKKMSERYKALDQDARVFLSDVMQSYLAAAFTFFYSFVDPIEFAKKAFLANVNEISKHTVENFREQNYKEIND